MGDFFYNYSDFEFTYKSLKSSKMIGEIYYRMKSRL